MSRRSKIVWRVLGAGTALLLAAGLAAPFVKVDSFGEGIQIALESSLGRRVEIGEVRLNLLTGPGFSVSNVVIHEDPKSGREPFAYVASLEARVSLWSLWSRRLEFSSLGLEEPSVNLVRTGAGPWNFAPLLSHAVGAQTPEDRRLPSIRVRAGRLNFKFGNTKSVFYFTNADLTLDPPSSRQGDWRVRFSGEPARTDRTARGFGRVTADGRWRSPVPGGGRLELELGLEKSSVSELITLARGHDIGLHGVATSRARLAGPVSDVRISGRLEIEDVHRWDVLPPHGPVWPLSYQGRLDLLAQRLELELAPRGQTPPPVSIRFRASDLLSNLRWGVSATINAMPMPPLVQVARHLGASLPENLHLEGVVAGAIGYAPESGIQGRLAAPEAVVRSEDSGPVRFASPEVLIDGGGIALRPTVMQAAGSTAMITADYKLDGSAADLSITADSMDIAELRSDAGRLLGADAVPLLENCQGGEWKGRLEYRRRDEEAGDWSGSFELADVRVPLPGFAEPLDFESAHVVLLDSGAVVSDIRGWAGDAEIEGEYRYLAEAARPHRFRLSIPEADAAVLEQFLQPALARRESFFTRALRFGRTRVPEWLRTRRAEGIIDIGSLWMADLRLEGVHARVLWDGATVEIPEFRAALEKGAARGRITVDLRRPQPVYRLAGRFQSIQWGDAEWDVETHLTTAGAGPELVANLSATGSFAGRSIVLGPDSECRAVSGDFEFGYARGLPRLLLPEFQALLGEEIYQGRGATTPEGQLVLELSSSDRQMRLAGTMSPLHLAVVVSP